jgi:lysophospholipase L1-like esterase
LISASFIAWTARTSPQSSLPQQQEKQSFEEQTNRDSDDTDVSPTIAQPQEQSPVDSNKQYLAKLKLELAKKWPNNRTIKVVAHGHSVPTGYFRGGRVETFSAYPHLLHRKIAKSYPTAVVSMMPTGIGGENAPQGMLRFEEDVLALKPDVVTIDYGLNDRTVGLKKARDAWSKMILAAKKHGVKVILLTPTGDLNADILDDDDPLSQHAAQIRELAAEHQVGLVDSYKIFREFAKRNGEYKTLMSQGNHPNRKGHLLVADELATWFSTQSD